MTDTCRVLLEHGAYVHAQNTMGATALFIAAEHESAELCELLIQHGANVNAVSKTGATPLFSTARKNRMLTALLLIEKGANVNVQDKKGLTPLQIATVNNFTDLIHVYIEAGADVNAANVCDKHTSLHLAVLTGSTTLAQLLLTRGACIEARDKKGHTPLLLAALHGNTDVAHTLIERGADIHTTLPTSVSASDVQVSDAAVPTQHVTEWNKDFERLTKDDQTDALVGAPAIHCASLHGHTDIVRLLMDKGVSVNATTPEGNTPLHFAASGAHAHTTHLLIEKGGDVRARNNVGAIPLHSASRCIDKATVTVLLEGGADVNAQLHNGATVLHLIAHKSPDLKTDTFLHGYMCLLEEKWHADTNIAMEVGFTPLHIACFKENDRMAELLIKRGANVHAVTTEKHMTPLLHAAQIHGYDTMRVLLENGGEVNARAKDGRTALHYVAQTNTLPLYELLIAHHTDVNARDEDGIPPLCLAAHMGYLDAVKLLIEGGADVTLAGNDGMTALFHAADEGHTAICKHIIDEDYAQKRTQHPLTGMTAVHFAAESGHKETAIALLDMYCCRPDTKDNRGVDPATAAQINGHYHVAEAIDAWAKKQSQIKYEPIPKHLMSPFSRGKI
eukprot:GDKI01030577.1.p1 GENE.GDKI01030577.1~~GDKI01030577.1.p1  ORF type:complete len:618 (-),score=143.86 GDKI01030577.1:270-2123(-)